MENELTPEQLAMDEAYQEAKKQSLITSLTGAAGFRLGWEAAEAYAAKQSQKDHLVELMKMDEEREYQLHPDSSNLLKHCFEELRLKMIKNQEKYGYGNEWLTEEWEQECRDNMMEHIQKGDPRDVAIYALFMMYRGWSTKPQKQDGEQCFTVDDVEKVWWIDRHAALAHLNTQAAAFRLDGMKKALDSVLNILKENQTASSQLVPEDAARSAQDIINETFSDLIEIVQSIKPEKP